MQNIEIPVNINDTVYYLDTVFHLDDQINHIYHYEKEIREYRVRSIHISCNAKGSWNKSFRAFEVINNKVTPSGATIKFEEFNVPSGIAFSSKEEAEYRLEEVKKEADYGKLQTW